MYESKKNQIGRTLLEAIAVVVLSTIVVMGIYKAFRLAVEKANTKKLEQDMGVRVSELRHKALTPSGITLGAIQAMKASNYTVETVMVNPEERTFTLRVGQDNANLNGKKPLSYEQCQSLVKSSTFSPNNANDACKENQAYADFVFPMFADLQKFASGEYNPTRSGEASPTECGVHALHDGTTCVCETGYENWRRGVGCTLIALTCDVNGFQEGIDCQCNAGYFGNGLVCTQCGERQYSAARANACDTCDPGQTHNADHTGCDNCTGVILGACGCDPDEIPDGDGGCETACPYDHSSTTERPGYQLSGTICYCESGYVPDNAQQECVPEDTDSDCRLGICQTCIDNGASANPRYRYGLLAAGTPCEISGLQGTCNGNGICYPTEGQACSSINGCPAGQFCNYGGTYNSGTHQSGHFGQTANVCMRVNAQRFVYKGSVYFYNTKRDLQAWCRAADNTANCTWGYLAKPGAESWCYSLGARLLTAAEINAVVDTDNQGNNITLWDVLKKKLPKTGSSYNYWLNKSYDRPDGYANSGGVVCYGGSSLACDHGEPGNNGCICDPGWYGELCDTTCNGFRDEGGRCYSCDDETAVHFDFFVPSNECAKCSNREWFDLDPYTDKYCVKKNSCSGFRDISGKCHSCDEDNSVHTVENECNKCADRTFSKENEVCSLTKAEENCEGIVDASGICHSCSDPDPFYLYQNSGECTAKCTNRELTGYANLYCALKGCDGFYGFHGQCLPCDTQGSVSVGSNSQCERCQNKMLWRPSWSSTSSYCVQKSCDGYRDPYGTCFSCDDEKNAADYGFWGAEAYMSECEKCPNREIKSWRDRYSTSRRRCVLKGECDGFYDTNGICHSCNETDIVDVSDGPVGECEKCPNREYLAGSRGNYNYCVLKTGCDGFYDFSQKCHSCDETDSVGANAEQCAKCSNRFFWNFQFYQCVLGPQERCDGFWGGSEVVDCYSCNDPSWIATSTEECAKCSDRELVFGYFCSLKNSCSGFYDYDLHCHTCNDENSVSTEEEECAKCAGQRTYSGGTCSKVS